MPSLPREGQTLVSLMETHPHARAEQMVPYVLRGQQDTSGSDVLFPEMFSLLDETNVCGEASGR